MSVKGRHVPGLIVDPGAARGVLGTDSLAELINAVLRPRHLQQSIVWHGSQAKFSGISSTVQHSHGVVSIPIGLQGIPSASYQADVLGDVSSWCPGLVPLRTLIANAEFLHFAFFDNGDGVLGIRHGNIIAPQRLLLTDSEHYLLRIDLFNKPVDQRLNQALAERLYQRLTRAPQPWQHGGQRQYTTHSTNWKPSVSFPVFQVPDDHHADDVGQDFQ